MQILGLYSHASTSVISKIAAKNLLTFRSHGNEFSGILRPSPRSIRLCTCTHFAGQIYTCITNVRTSTEKRGPGGTNLGASTEPKPPNPHSLDQPQHNLTTKFTNHFFFDSSFIIALMFRAFRKLLEISQKVSRPQFLKELLKSCSKAAQKVKSCFL